MSSLRKIARLLSAFILCVIFMPYFARAEERTRLTVAYIDYSGFLEKSETGEYVGYGADYMNKIAEYTGWEYEYIDMDWPTGLKAVKEGAVDFYCVARQTTERQADYDFSLFPICNEELNIYARSDSEIYFEDYAAFDGLTVGVLAESVDTGYFRAYSVAHGFTNTIIEYPTNGEVVSALANSEVDIIAIVSYAVEGEFKLVGGFGASPAYLMSREGSPYMAEFSKAQEQLYIDMPDYSRALQNAHYGHSGALADLLLTRGEAEYIKNAPPLTVAVSVDMAPIEYYDGETGTFKGVTVDLYGRISEMTGLKFAFVKRPDAPELIAKMERGEIDLVGTLAQSEAVAEALRLIQTQPFSVNSLTLVTNDMAALTENSRVAVPAGYPKFANTAKQNGYTLLDEYPTFEECVDAVYAGKADLTYVITMCEGYLLDHARYSDLRAYPSVDAGYGMCFGVYDGYDSRLIAIVNKCISAIPDKDVNEIIVANTAHAEPAETVKDVIARNGMLIFAGGVVLVAVIACAVIRAMKEKQRSALNKNLKQHHDYLQHLYDTLPCGVIRYAFAPPHRVISYNYACAKIYGYEDGNFPIVGEKPDSAVESGTEEAFQEKFALCEATGPIIYVWPVTKKDGSRIYTESVMDIVDTEGGKVFQEIVIDVTARTLREQEIEKRYAQELSRRGNRDAGMLYTACFDVTEQRLTDTDMDVPGIHPGMSVSEFMDCVLGAIMDLRPAIDIADFAAMFTCERLMAEYDGGRYERSINLCRRRDGQIQWLRSDLALRLNPATGHLMCFDYIWDITDEHVTGEIVRRMALANCESFMSVYMPTGRCLQYEADKSGELVRTDSVYGENDIISRFLGCMSAEDAPKFREITSLNTVSEYLKTEPRYQIYATLTGDDGARLDKALVYFYTNEENGVLAVTVTDVTKVRADEVRRAQLLSDALTAAEKADVAKSQFLSRVSHEMRTPLNAIIGFIDLAKEADAEQTVNLLASSDIAAKQLLNVINDVLDMSAIESGKLKIASASFNFRHLITAVTNIYGTQCKQKDVEFEAVMETPIEEWLVGDELRVNQILMNLLGNAVKFTSEGHIHLKVAQKEIDGERVLLRFAVSDTGFGMSDEMQRRLFKPFEQENVSTARKYGGSGLGLSIVKNLVDAMGGSIGVVSRQGEGSTFTVSLPFRKSDINQDILLPRTADTLRILIIDDEQAEREYMGLVLKRVGVRYSSAESGEEALKILAQAREENDLFNVCLVDWRMPGMDGLDITHRIREMYGEDKVILVVSAYDFQHIGDGAMKAGANLFLSKPIFQSTIFDLLMTLTGGKIAEVKEKPENWDFVGKRVLLVEDNALNRIIAEANLVKHHIVVDVAENGQIAVDKFLKSKPGYYDCILMDIQMPVMDGLEATGVIRASNHPQAKTIQIIAQTADAFNEDIIRVLNAGMNAHVAKPIDQTQLAKELRKAFSHSD